MIVDEPALLSSAMSAQDTELDPAAAAERLREPAWQAVDVRLAYERDDDGVLAGDVHIALTELSERAGEIDPERPVLVYCHTGSRSAMAVAALRGAGYEAYNLAGGIVAWTAAGLPVTRPAG
jgi:rhodanese-related sulfurtransferase